MDASPLNETERQELARILFPDSSSLPSINELEDRYPPRTGEGAISRVAPSPTGFAHIGFIYTSLINSILAKQTGGKFILRIEDTDTAREIKGATDTILDSLGFFGITPDEGLFRDALEGYVSKGAYGPYIQSQRKSTYRAVARHLILQGHAYPCFCTEEDLKRKSEQQIQQRLAPGYYGYWAEWRDRGLSDILDALKTNPAPVIRLRSIGAHGSRIEFTDGIKGRVSFPKNNRDIVIVKSDGQSLYHLAHAVDDHFMRVTDVVRGDEWLSSVPIHLQIFQLLNWTAPRYAHLATIQKSERELVKNETTGEEVERQIKRKLSKRKDPDASALYYLESGFPAEAVVEYLLNIANSGFEEWRKVNSQAHYLDFRFDLSKCNASGALSDLIKLGNVSKEVIARFTPDELLNRAIQWTSKYDTQLHDLLTRDLVYSNKCLQVESSAATKKSKRVANWRDLRRELSWCFRETFETLSSCDEPASIPTDLKREIISAFLESLSLADCREEWFNKCKRVAMDLKFSPSTKEFKINPEGYHGHIGDVTMIIRVALCRSTQSPDLYEVIQLLGEEEVRRRLEQCEMKAEKKDAH